MSLTDADAGLRAALELQAITLVSLARRLEFAAHSLVPDVDSTRWNGPAQLAYAVIVHDLRQVVVAAGVALVVAGDMTRTALASVNSRVG